MTIRRRPAPRKANVGQTPAERDSIALALLQRARDPLSSGVYAVWYGGGHGIAIARTPAGEREAITWRQADRLAFPEKYIEKKPPTTATAAGKISTQVEKLSIVSTAARRVQKL